MTDADGSSLGRRALLGSDAGFQLACIVSGNDTLQRELIAAVGRGIDRLAG